MRVYRYYIQGKNIPYMIGGRGNANDWVLYAYTTDKDVKKYFEETRNLKRFRRIKSKMSKKEYRSFKQDSVMDELTTEEYLYFTHDIGEDGKRIPLYTTIALTRNEQETLSTVMDGGFLLDISDHIICPAIFKKKYYKALKILQYVAAYRYWACEQVEGERTFKKIMTMMNEKEERLYGEADPHTIPEIDYDEVELILSIFGSTF